MFCTCWLKAITASSNPVNIKPFMKSLIFGKIKKSHGARFRINAGWVTSFTFSEVKNDIILFAVFSETLSWCNRLRLLGRFSLTFSKILGKQMMVYRSALTIFCSPSGIVQTGHVLKKKKRNHGLLSPKYTHTEDLLSYQHVTIYPCWNIVS
ncbi:hypothetical protein EVAR_27445_1 [Eumeta japonica]|uniref:Uncharacterized protein n=1 Tax=Eumeta variegata TaxID=151549 RepID=A0A4C1VMU1_EUMVA|nr:hypothetical protein EVAR_27445_1 [Eumeta japonica]